MLCCYYYHNFFFFFWTLSCFHMNSLNNIVIPTIYNYLPTPLFWSISKSFFILSSLDCKVCFCVSILSSSSCGKKLISLQGDSSPLSVQQKGLSFLFIIVTLIVSLRMATSRVKWSFSFNNNSTCCCNSIFGPRIRILSSSSS